MQVTDLQTAEKFFFVLDRWLAVDRDDGCVSISVVGSQERWRGKDDTTKALYFRTFCILSQ